MKKGLFRAILCIILALLMGLGSPLMSMAEEQDGLYLADLKIGYGDDGKASLIAKGYKVYNQNVNDGGQGNAVYIGYKTTNKTSEAITDIATMNMNGRYSFDKYAKYIQTIVSDAETAAKKFIVSVNEFAGKFENGQATTETSEIAKETLEILNKFYDDDYKDPEGQVSNKIGDMIINGKMTESELAKIYYQGNSEVIDTIKKLIAFGITETAADTFLTRLKNYSYSDKLEASLATARTDLLNQFSEIREYLLTAQEYGEAAAEYEKGKKAYINSFSTADDQTKVATYIGVYEATTSTQYGSDLSMPDGDYMTLFDALTLPTEDEYITMEEEPECKYSMDAYMIEILAKALTPGQRGSADAVPAVTFIINASCASKDVKTSLKNIINEVNECSAISVFAEVDRSLFDHPEDVALTAASIEEMNKGGQNNIGRDVGYWDNNKEVKISMITLAAVAAVVGVALLVYGFVRKSNTAYAISQCFKWDIARSVPGEAAYAGTVAYKNVTMMNFIGSAVAFVIMVICLIVLLVKSLEKPEQPKEFTYTKIPRALVHMIEGEENTKEYYNYYAVTRIDASDDDSDYMNVYGDLNGYSKTCQWECLYITRDSRCGKPLSADIEFVTGSPDTAKNSSNGYLPIHGFDSEAVADLNAHTASENPTKIYAYAKIAVEPTDTPNQGGSIFESNPVAMCIAALILGAGLSYGATLLITKKRRTA